jgi:hypothetical protein
MNNVIEPNFDMQWILPVWVLIQGKRRPVHGPSEAIGVLNREIPALKSSSHERALSACWSSVNGNQRLADSRKAFFTACEQAGCLM